MDLRSAFHRRVAAMPATACAAHTGAAERFIPVNGSALDVTRGDGPTDLAFSAGPDIGRLISGELAPERAIANEVVEAVIGSVALLGRFATTFHLPV